MKSLRPIGFLLTLIFACLLFVPSSEARSSGGRSGGGSFKRSTPSRSSGESNSRQSTPSRSTENGGNANPRENNSRSNAPGYYAPIYPAGGASPISSGEIALIFLLLGGGGTLVLLVVGIWYLTKDRSGGVDNHASLPREARNETVTVSKVQVALYAHASRSVQSDLIQLSEEADLESTEGLKQFLEEAVLVLFRQVESWSHALGTSDKLKRDQAEPLFEKWSFEERSKFSAETFSNMKGRIKSKTHFIPDDDVAAYIVVTIIVGTEHDKPLFGEIRNREQLHEALTALVNIPQDFLLTVEVLWSPQVDGDSLTEDEMISEYTQLIAL